MGGWLSWRVLAHPRPVCEIIFQLLARCISSWIKRIYIPSNTASCCVHSSTYLRSQMSRSLDLQRRALPQWYSSIIPQRCQNTNMPKNQNDLFWAVCLPWADTLKTRFGTCVDLARRCCVLRTHPVRCYPNLAREWHFKADVSIESFVGRVWVSLHKKRFMCADMFCFGAICPSNFLPFTLPGQYDKLTV